MGKVKVTRGTAVLEIDESKVEAARAQGFQLVPDEVAKAKVLRESASSIGGTIRGGVSAIASGMTLGVSDWAAEKLGADPEVMKAERQGMAPLEVAGAVLPALVTGGSSAAATGAVRGGALARGAATALKYSPAGLVAQGGAKIAAGRGLAGAAAGAAFEGGVEGAVRTLGEEALGGPEVTASRVFGNAVKGAGLGAVLGVGMHGALAGGAKAARGLATVGEGASATAGKLARGGGAKDKAIKLWAKATGAAPEDFRTVVEDMLPTKEGRRILLEGPEAAKKSRAALAERLKTPVDKMNDVWEGIRKQTGADHRIGNAERKLTQAETDAARGNALGFVQRQLADIEKRLANPHLSPDEITDLTKFQRYHEASVAKLEDAAVSGGEAFRAVDRLRQDIAAVKKGRYAEHSRNARPETLDAAQTAQHFTKAARDHTTDAALYGDAAREHGENLQAWVTGIDAAAKLKKKSPALGKLFEKGATDADITPLLTLARGRMGATKEAGFEAVFEARAKAIEVLERNHDLTPELRAQIAEFKLARKAKDKAIKDNASLIEKTEAFYRIRQAGESGHSPSNVGVQAASTVGTAVGFGIGGVPGAIVGGAVGALTKPFSSLRAVATMMNVVESMKLRERGIISGAGQLMDGLPSTSTVGRAAAKVPSAARRGVTTYESTRRRREAALAVRDKVNDYTVEPLKLMEHLDDEVLLAEAPNTYRARYTTAARAVAYLKSVEPQTYKPLFSGGTELVDPVQVERYEMAVTAITDPYGTLERLVTGLLAPEHLNALDAVHPELMATVRDGVLEEVGERVGAGKAIDWRARTRLGQMLRMPLDDSQRPGIYLQIQEAISGNTQANPGMEPPGAPKRGRKAIQTEDMKSENLMTDSERRASGINRA